MGERDLTDDPRQPTDPQAMTNPWTADEEASARKWAQDYFTSHQIPKDWGEPQDLVNNYFHQRALGVTHQDAMDKIPGLLGWDKYQAPGTTPPAGPPAGPPANTPPALGPSDPSAIFQAPVVNGLPSWLPDAPKPDLPTFGKAPAYTEPNYADALNDNGYQFEASEGTRQMEQSAAARGVLNGGGTLKDINAWGQNFATQRVNDVRDRSVNNYLLNYQTQNVDPYKYAYQNALDTFTGKLGAWQTQAQVGQRNAEDVFQQAYTPFNDLWNRRIQVGLA